MNKKIILFILISNYILVNAEFNKVVIWGHKLYSHTHSFIHYGFHKAFKYLGYDTYWLDNSDNISGIDFANALFITEGQVDGSIPIRPDCTYILHNCLPDKYQAVVPKKQLLFMQVYTNDCENRGCQKLAPYILYDVEKRIIYMPWATDLLPHEINLIKNRRATHDLTGSYIVFFGQVGTGFYGNIDKLEAVKKASEKLGLNFICNGNDRAAINSICNLGMEESIKLINNAYLAPAIQGQWQCDTGYIPCRIFKNVSYGKLGITNNKTVYDLFNQKIVYNPDCYQLCLDAQKRMQTITQEELFEQMDFVRDHHTYLNRVVNVLEFIERLNTNL